MKDAEIAAAERQAERDEAIARINARVAPGWSKSPTVVGPLLKFARANKLNENGIFNTVVVLRSSMGDQR